MTTFAGYDLMDFEPNIREDPQYGIDRDMDRLENAVGYPLVIDARPPRITTNLRFFFDTSAASWDFITEWVPARQGRRVPFWVPTRNVDLAAIEYVGGTSFLCHDNGALALWNRHPKQRHYFMIRGWSGTNPYAEEYIEAVSMVAGSDPNTVVINPGGISINLVQSIADKVLTVSRMYLMRQATDDVTVEWYGRELAEATMSMIEVPAAEYP
jgi:hypothetical protein